MASPVDPQFSVVVPTHGRPAFLSEALASILAQSVTDLEVVVVDDASPEPVELPAAADDDGRVRVVRRARNGGPAAARNTGAAASRGRLLAFLDDDDWWEPQLLARLSEALDVTSADVAVCWSRYHDEPPHRGRLLEGDVHDVIVEDITPHFGATVLRRQAWQPLDEGYLGSEDVAWWLGLSERTTLTTVPACLHVIRRHGADRGRHGAAARAEGGLRLLDEHAAYFDAHPRSAAFRLKRVGLQAMAAGDRATARRALLRSMRLQPDARVLRHLARALVPDPSARGAG